DLDVASAGDDDEDLAVLPPRGDGIGQGRLGVDAEPPHIDRRVQFADGQACLGAGLRPPPVGGDDQRGTEFEGLRGGGGCLSGTGGNIGVPGRLGGGGGPCAEADDAPVVPDQRGGFDAHPQVEVRFIGTCLREQVEEVPLGCD